MAEQRIDVAYVSPASPDRLWAVLTDVSTWTGWAPFDAVELESPGSPERDGVGAVRVLRRGNKITRERVVAFDPGSWHFAYELLEGVPARDYRADVTLEPLPGGGTTIRWRSRFRGRLPGQGPVVRLVLRRFVDDLVKRLAVHGM
ncbi:SRPBCC family protein [Planomonospora sp. ID67723]|uniref:SRPBCC family protein n=1 Tax=Planomonospora sp. ID67723 TaxID=2738134 RepID=UPI0018C3D6D6|nr:SRPBCC family protein [Planomonospora sp. ID67723]MBG0830397.1 SRPBCC family protein [Planomonospora sp. ID67723]